MADSNEELKAKGTTEYLAVMGALGAARETMGSLGHTMGEIIQRLPHDTPPPPPPVEEPPPAAEEQEPEDPSSETEMTETPAHHPAPGYEWMERLSAPVADDAVTGPFPLFINSNQSAETADLTGLMDGITWVGSSMDKGWGEHGPKWLVRAYNAYGTIQDLEAWRVGDFHKGREGHLLYCNVYGDLALRNVKGVQCGGQWGQFVWRPSETRLPGGDGPNPSNTLRIEDCEAIDCGAINHGVAVRASWPLSFYNPGHRLIINGFKVRTDLPGFEHPGKHGVWKSHGGIFVGPGQIQRRCPSLHASGLDIEVTQSDRELVRLWMVDEVELSHPRIVNHGGQPTVAIVDDCGSVVIDRPVDDVLVKFHQAHKPYGMAYKEEIAMSGKTYEWHS